MDVPRLGDISHIHHDIYYCNIDRVNIILYRVRACAKCVDVNVFELFSHE